MTRLIHLIYASAAVHQFTATELAGLLERSRTANARIGVTGILLVVDGSFFQVLEGAAEHVDALFAVIAKDWRHQKPTVIIREPIANRAFGNWSMGFLWVQPRELAGIAGFCGADGSALSFDSLEPGRARRLLNAFAAGRWRLRVSGLARTA